MTRYFFWAGFVSLLCLFVSSGNTDAIGRNGGGGGGNRGGGGGGGGGGARPAPSRPAPSRPAGGGPSIARPSAPAARPKPSPPNGIPGAGRPNPPAAKGNNPRPGGGGDFKMPGNAQRPSTLPKNRPDVNRPGNAGKDFKGKRPDIGKVSDKAKGNLGDLQKKNPGLFDRPKGDGPISGKRPSNGDLSNWLGMPNHRPGNAPGRPLDRPGRDKINNDFNNNWKNAIGGNNKVNIGNKNIGNINVDLSKNANFNNLSRNANVVHNNFRGVQNNWFNQNWWNGRNYNWPRWHYHYYPRPAAHWWRPCTWAACTAFMAGAAWTPPVYYDYGSNVVIQQDVVYVNEQPVASAPVYAQQAIDLASVPPPAPEAKLEWLPLGTFALASKKDDDNPNTILQLALSKEGMVSGVWYNRTTDVSSDVEGRVDPETQRVALRKPDQPDVVLEVGVYNLTQVATPCLIHFGTLQTQTAYLTRLEAQE